jgi:ribosomal protein S18
MADCDTQERVCKDCGESKNLAEHFYKSKKLANGEQKYRVVCKFCVYSAKHGRTYLKDLNTLNHYINLNNGQL